MSRDRLIVAGGDTEGCFAKGGNPGVTEAGCQNLKDFISKGGSAMGICNAGTAFFANATTWIGLTGAEAKAGMKWTATKHTFPGRIVQAFGGEAIFKGSVVGPQESNLPYPRTRFIPLKMNADNQIVKDASVVFQ